MNNYLSQFDLPDSRLKHLIPDNTILEFLIDLKSNYQLALEEEEEKGYCTYEEQK
jgi:hypothetical protein